MSAVLGKWQVAKISDFAKTTSGGTPSRKNPEYYTGQIPWIKSGDLNDGNVSQATEFITEEALKSSSAKLFPAGTLMIALYGATIGKLGILSIDAATNQAVCGIFVPEEVETKYLFYFLLYHRRELVKKGAGGAQPNITQGIVRDIQVPRPPLPEQRRIVARIEELFSRLDAGVAALRHAKAQLQRYRQSVLNAAVTGELTKEWREQHPDVEPSNQLLERILKQRREQWNGRGKYTDPITPNDTGDLPADWTQATSDQLVHFVTSGSRGWAKYYSDEGAIFIRIGNLEHENIALDLRDIQRVKPPEGAEGSRTRVQTNDILISITADVGMVALVDTDIGEAYINQHVALARPSKEVNPRFLAWLLASKPTKSQWKLLQRGATKVGLGLDDIRAVQLGLPPIAEQHQIVAEVESRITAIDHLESELNRQITRSNRLRQSTLAAAFSGRLVGNLRGDQHHGQNQEAHA